jgi:hypothetical protein
MARAAAQSKAFPSSSGNLGRFVQRSSPGLVPSEDEAKDGMDVRSFFFLGGEPRFRKAKFWAAHCSPDRAGGPVTNGPAVEGTAWKGGGGPLPVLPPVPLFLQLMQRQFALHLTFPA